MNIGFAITSSYCTIKEVLIQMQILKDLGYNVIPIVSTNIVNENTRFGTSESIIKSIEAICEQKVIQTIVEAEKFGPKEPLDAIIICPTTGNTIAKLAHGITDNTVCMAAKATLRNKKPVIIGVSTNDGLGLNGENIMKLYNTKGFYFVPFYQDDYEKKPNSLIANFNLVKDTLELALNEKQIQPIINDKNYIKK